MAWVPLVFLLLFAPPWPGPPPSMDASVLVGAEDDGDIPDEAFFALVDHVRSWPEGAKTPGVRLEVARDDLLRDPSSYRGLLLVIKGRVEQHRDLGAPFEDVQEWFIRDGGGDPCIVYVVGDTAISAVDGTEVIMEAHFYKRMLLEDRSGVQRAYPALAGAFPIVLQPADDAPIVGVASLWALLAILSGGLLLVILLARKVSGRQASRRAIVLTEDSLPPDPPLPEEADEALRELKRRGHDDPA
ncbi:MAG: hypothetical protein CMJ36_02690 [Phycisphaerae bacterium]|nr:hypothetical protein [Phycisphaerae bacterium]